MRRLILLGLAGLIPTAGAAQEHAPCDRLVALVERHGTPAGTRPLPMGIDQARAFQRENNQQACRDALPRIEAAAQEQVQRSAPQDATGAIAPAAATRIIPVSRIVTMAVADMDGREVGKVERVVIGDDERIYAVVGIGGFLGIGERKVLLALDDLALSGDKLVIPRLSEQDLRALPAWSRSQGKDITGDRTTQMQVVE